ncbi:MAG: hypothetical protein QXN14_05905 [Ignisphaera sp.]
MIPELATIRKIFDELSLNLICYKHKFSDARSTPRACYVCRT